MSSAIVRGIPVTLGAFWLAFQFYIMFYPQIPLVQRPLHLMLALALVILTTPLAGGRIGRLPARLIDGILLLGVLATTAYYFINASRLTERMEGIDEILTVDILAGVFLVIVVLEGVRRLIGWTLLGVLLLFLVYAAAGSWFPGWLRFGGFNLEELVENFSMTANGLLGITTETSVIFVFYFVVFGAIYSAIGGSQLFIDIGIRLTGRHQGGAAKAAVVSSSLMGSISGSAVANVAATGVFTIPLMRRTGFSREMAAATEAISSTGGQLMPPIMGIAAFVMAEMLQIPYARIALAGLIPAIAFYLAIFLAVDLRARKTGLGTLPRETIDELAAIAPRLYLLIPPVILVGVLVSGYSATYAAVVATGSCLVTAYLGRASWLGPRDWLKAVEGATRQAAEVAVPIAAIGIIISVAIQSNLALKFSSSLIEISGGTLFGAMFFIILGCLVMGMGLPTVAAYIIGAILFVPALLELGIPELPAHFFVMYYSVLSMITPPVALASFTAAGLAGANSMLTSLLAFRMSAVAFFIPFAFAFDESLLGQGSPLLIAIAFASLMAGTGGWAIALVGYLGQPLGRVERLLFAAGALGVIFMPTGTAGWGAALVAVGALTGWCLLLKPRMARESAARSHE